jgi:hypothetical protein
MATGYQGPGRTLFHRLRRGHVGAVLIEETWCGIKPDRTTWTAHKGTEPDCTRCARAWQRHLDTQQPFAPGEKVLYTSKRHPGLMHFLPQYSGGNKPMAWAWRVNGADRTHWLASEDQRAPRGRPIQLGLGIVGVEPVGYHTTVLAAVEWTKILVVNGALVPLYRKLRAGTWDPQAENLPLSDTASGAMKETNPA